MNKPRGLRRLRPACAGLMLMLSLAGPQPALALDVGDPTIAYFLREQYMLNPQDKLSDSAIRLAESGSQYGGDLSARREYGGSMLGTQAVAAVSVYNGGKTFLAEAVSPRLGSGDVYGTSAEVFVAQSFLKLNTTSTLSFTFSAAKLQLLSFGDGLGDGWSLYSYIEYEVWAVNHATGEEFWRESQYRALGLDYGASTDGADNRIETYRDHEFTGNEGLVGNPDWGPWGSTGYYSSPGQGNVGTVLSDDFTGYVDLSNLRQFEEFTVAFRLKAAAVDRRQGETGTLAYIKDPVSTGNGSGITLSGDGLQATNNVLAGTLPVPEPGTWALWALGLALLGGATRRRTGDGAPAGGVRQRAPRWMR
jgi:hypothetical protein